MSCSTEYCISNTNHPEYDDNFTSNGDYDGYPSWSGLTNGYYIYFNTRDKFSLIFTRKKTNIFIANEKIFHCFIFFYTTLND